MLKPDCGRGHPIYFSNGSHALPPSSPPIGEETFRSRLECVYHRWLFLAFNADSRGFGFHFCDGALALVQFESHVNHFRPGRLCGGSSSNQLRRGGPAGLTNDMDKAAR
jgi:hypothetical protein